MVKITERWGLISTTRKLQTLALIYLIVSLILIYFLMTVDLFNFQMFIKITSYLFLSQNPYIFYPNQFPPNYFSFLLPTFLIYLHTGYNILEAIQFLKIFQMLISTASAYVVYLFILHYSGNKNRAIAGFTAVLLSPVIMWVNFFQLEQSSVGIAFTLFALYTILVLVDEKEGGFLVLLAGTILLWYSVYLYLFPIAIIPTLFVYQKSRRKFVVFLFAMILGFIISYIPFTLHNMFDIIGGTAAIATAGSSGVGYTIIGLLGSHIFPPNPFQLFLKEMFSLTFLISIFFIPILLRFLKKNNIFLPITISLISVFILQTITNLDEFSWVLPFLSIFLAISLDQRHLIPKLFLSQLYDIPYIILFIIDDSNWGVNGSGFFYLSYLQFHLNIDLYEYTWAIFVMKTLILLGFTSFIILISILLHKSKGKKNIQSFRTRFAEGVSSRGFIREEKGIRTENNKKDNGLRLFQRRSYNKKVGGVLFTFSIITIVILSTFGTFIIHNEVHTNGNNYPFGFFSSEAVVGINTTYQFVDNYKSIVIYPTNTNYNYPPISPFVFSRNVTGEQISMNMSFTTSNTVSSPFNSTIFKVGNASINIFNDLKVRKNGSLLTHPRLLITLVKQNTTEYTITNSTNFGFKMSSNHFTILSENHTINGFSNDGSIYFGRLSFLTVPLILSISDFKIISDHSDSSMFIIILDSILLPIISLTYIYYTRREV